LGVASAGGPDAILQYFLAHLFNVFFLNKCKKIFQPGKQIYTIYLRNRCRQRLQPVFLKVNEKRFKQPISTLTTLLFKSFSSGVFVFIKQGAVKPEAALDYS
jgi:hypothetical protein